MEIDLTAMTPEMTRDLNRIAERYRKPYTEFIDGLSERFADAKFWWDTPLASRNTFICRNFLDICLLRLAMDIVNQGRMSEWVVHNIGMRLALKDNLGACNIRVASSLQGFKAKMKEVLLGSPWISSEYAFYSFQRRIRKMQTWHNKKSLDAFLGRELTLVSTYRVPAEIRTGMLQDRYFSGLKGTSDEDIVFLALSVFDSEAEGKQLFDVLHATEDHICIEEWIEPNDFQEVRKYIWWCRNVGVPQCTFDGMDVTALVKEALRNGAADENTMYGIVKGRALCRLLEQQELHIKCLVDWYEGQPSSNAMIRRFRAKYPDVSTVACSPFPYEENLLSLFPSERQIEKKVVPEYFSVMGQAWESQIYQFSNKVKCVTVPSFRHQEVWADVIETSTERKGLLVVLSLFEDCSAQLLAALGSAINGMDSASIGPIYIKNHPVHQAHHISDYGVEESLFQGWDVIYLFGDIHEALCDKKVVVLTKTTSTLEIMLSGAYVINFIPRGDLSMVSLPEGARKKITVAYSAEELRDCLQATPERLSAAEVEELREVSFTRVNRQTINGFLDCSCTI